MIKWVFALIYYPRTRDNQYTKKNKIQPTFYQNKPLWLL